MNYINHIFNMDCISGMKLLPDESVNCCVTSPPYFGLRDYGHEDQIGLEETPEQYIQKMVEVFRKVKRVLRNDGTLWLNLGDSYCSTAPNTMGDKLHQRGILQGVSDRRSNGSKKFRPKTPTGLKPKDLIGIPWMVAFALRADGWYLRQDIIWSKPNPMPESVTDRCTKAHEYIFLLSKSQKYHYDHEAIKKPVADQTVLRMMQQIENQKGSDRVPGKTNGAMKAVGPGRNPRKGIDNNGGNQASENRIPAMRIRPNGITRDRLLDYDSKEKQLRGQHDRVAKYESESDIPGSDGYANKKSVWTVTTKPFKEAHFATFPQDLIIDCIKAGCPEGGLVLDPFMGAGTTAVVSKKLGRNYTGFELNPEYIKIQNKYLHKEIGLFQ